MKYSISILGERGKYITFCVTILLLFNTDLSLKKHTDLDSVI